MDILLSLLTMMFGDDAFGDDVLVDLVWLSLVRVTLWRWLALCWPHHLRASRLRMGELTSCTAGKMTKLMQGDRNAKNQKNLGGDSTEIRTKQNHKHHSIIACFDNIAYTVRKAS